MKNTKPTISLDEVIKLKKIYQLIYDENSTPYPNTEDKVTQFNDIVFSKPVNIDPNTSPKDVGIILENWHETLTQAPVYSEPTVTKTTFDKDESADLIEKAEIRNKQIEEARINAEKEVERARLRQEEIIKQQKVIEEQIKKNQTIQEEIKDKKVYIKVEKTQEIQFSEEETTALNGYKKEAIEHPEETIEKLNTEIQSRVVDSLKEQGLEQEEIKLITRSTAQKIVENLTEMDSPEYISPTESFAINNKVTENIPNTFSEEVKTTLESSIKVVNTHKNLPDIFLKDVAKNAFGQNFANYTFGINPDNYQITISETKQPGYSRYYDFSNTNQTSTQILQGQNKTLSFLKTAGKDEAKNYVLNRFANTFPTTTFGKQFLSKSANEALFYSTFAGAGKTVTWTGGNFIGNAVIKFAPQYAPYLNYIGQATGIKFLTPVVTKTVIKEAVGQVTGKIIGQAVGSTVGAAAGATGAEAGAAIGAIAGGGTPLSIAFAAIGTVVGAIFGKIIEKINWAKVKKWLSDNGPILLGLGGLVTFGPMVGAGLFIGGIALTGGLTAATAGFVAGLGFIWSKLVLPVFITPIIIGFFVLIPIVAFIMFVINSGAYVLPQNPMLDIDGADNPYIMVTKTASVRKMTNPTTPQTVTYTVTIKALKGLLTNLSITSTECRVIKRNKTNLPCPVEILPDLPSDLEISPSNEYTFAFNMQYDSKFNDALIFDSVSVKADTLEQENVKTTGSESICIGDCPIDCVVVSDAAKKWPTNLRSNSETALGDLSSQYQGFMANVCRNNEKLNLCYDPSKIKAGYYAWHAGERTCDVYFNKKGVGSANDALFMITHELTHHIQKINGKSVDIYKSSGAYKEVESKGFCTYEDTKGNEYESMAEANGLFTAVPSWGSCVSNYSKQYPKNYNYAKKFMK